MSIVALVSDLVLQSQLRGAAARAEREVAFTATSDALIEFVADMQPSLVILDLSHPGINPLDIVPRVRRHHAATAILAFGPHVHRERLSQANEAGCDLVMSRGQFHAEMEDVLRRFDGASG